MFPSEDSIPINESSFRLLRDLIYEYCGIYFDDTSQYLLQRRLSRRVRSKQLNSFQDYYYLLKYDPGREEELNEVIDVLTTNETYFFRESNQLKAFTDEILPELVERKTNEISPSLRIWSAGCSTGEEPYSIAILLLEARIPSHFEIEIFASDISQRVLKVARNGLYTKSSFRATAPKYIQRYFNRLEKHFQVVHDVKKLVNFGQLNLLDEGKLVFVKKMDVIFCRNVIIYFDAQAKRRVIDNLFNRLKPGGFLLLGHSESLINISTQFNLRHFVNDMVYQKSVQELDFI
ncbi:protein-glutamate O-methyltransferase CheR [bacterium]|nr:protein-glutamate O-methyltransferase CheR [bacterium]